MEFDDAVGDRRSVRKFESKEIEKAKLKELIEIIRYVPSAHNLQDYYVYVVKNKAIMNQLTKACHDQKFIAEAPVVFVFFADSSKEGTPRAELYSLQSATMAAYAVSLKATDLKLGSCWIGLFKDEEVSKILEAKGNLRPVAVIPVGYPAEDPPTPKRKDDYFEIVE